MKDLLEYRVSKEEESNKKNYIACDCGALFLLVQNCDEMTRIIKMHAQVHASQEKDAKKAQTIANQIEDLLTSQVIEQVSKNGDNRAEFRSLHKT